MKFDKLFSLQRDLNNHIEQAHHLTGPLLSKKILALQVEIGELANETRCFKYWSNKGPSSKSVILEEYVDCLHFILSIGLDKNYDNITFTPNKSDTEITDQFLNLFIDINDFITCNSRDHYITLFQDFISLGLSLDFSIDDIENGYLEKNQINHKRQEEGY
ncbi:dUTP diphosphatase [Haloimpatiens lingqiaonensis]|uniref:dUTP diphosphatase n=1 Tax=Haloimpatiens lingqiaonensis TaxID=1380675 RepID=UPI0010FE32A1|nr:dUTP diphosphatase [Haloimpatiens lingqiaonensis]